jgi:hypothetical protein
VSATSPGTRYVLCILKPTKEHVIDRDDLAVAMRGLTHRESTSIPEGDYVVIAGTTGEPPVLVAGSNRPFASSIRVGAVPVDIRMDSWLAADTMRRMGFGHVIAARRHTLTMERGISFVAFSGDGRPLKTAYFANVFAPQMRFVIDARAMVE